MKGINYYHGLADALNKIVRKTMIAIRRPSLGPVMGIKGGAAGGGYARKCCQCGKGISLHFAGICMPLQLLIMPFLLDLATTYTKEMS